MQSLWITRDSITRDVQSKCLLEVWDKVGHFARDCPTQDPQPTKALGRLHHTLEVETPIGRSLLNEFFNKLMRSERKQEIAKAKLEKRLDNS